MGLSWIETLVIKHPNVTINFHSDKRESDYYSRFPKNYV